MQKQAIYLSSIYEGQYFTEASLANESIEELCEIFNKRRAYFDVEKDGYYVTRRAYKSGEIVDILDITSKKDRKQIEKTKSDKLEIGDYDDESNIIIIFVGIDLTLDKNEKLWKSLSPLLPLEEVEQVSYFFESDIGEEEQLETIESQIVVGYESINDAGAFNNTLYKIGDGLTRELSQIVGSGYGITTNFAIAYLQVITFYEGVIKRRNQGQHNDYVLGVDEQYEIIGGPAYGSVGGGAYINDIINILLLQKREQPLTSNEELVKVQNRQLRHNVEFVKCNDIVNVGNIANGLEELTQHMTLIVRATEDIEEGEELFGNYGYAFWEDVRLEIRRKFYNFLQEKYVVVIDDLLMDFLVKNFIAYLLDEDLEKMWVQIIARPYTNDLLTYIEEYHVRQSKMSRFDISLVLRELWSKIVKPTQIIINDVDMIQALSALLQQSRITDQAFVVEAVKNKTSPTKKQKLSCLACGYDEDVDLLRKEFNSLRIFCNRSCQRQYYKGAKLSL